MGSREGAVKEQWGSNEGAEGSIARVWRSNDGAWGSVGAQHRGAQAHYRNQ